MSFNRIPEPSAELETAIWKQVNAMSTIAEVFYNEDGAVIVGTDKIVEVWEDEDEPTGFATKVSYLKV